MEHLYKVYPKTDIAGILPNKKRIQDPTILKLNRREFIKCMNAGTVYAIVDGEEVLIEDKDYNKAEEMFNNINTVSDNVENHSDSINNETPNEHIDNNQKSQMNQSSSKRKNRYNKQRRN